jgi:hypothetical protein
MQDKTKKQKKAKKEIKVHDLKPQKDAKGGQGHNTVGGSGNLTQHGLH